MDTSEVREVREEHREWMSPLEVAEWLGIARSKVYDLIYQRAFRSYKIDSRRLIRRSDLLTWLAEREYDPTDDVRR